MNRIKNQRELGDTISGIETALRILNRLGAGSVDAHNLRTASSLLSQASGYCNELVGASRVEYLLEPQRRLVEDDDNSPKQAQSKKRGPKNTDSSDVVQA